MITKRISQKELPKEIPQGVDITHLKDGTSQVFIVDETKSSLITGTEIPIDNTITRIVLVETKEQTANRLAKEALLNKRKQAEAIVEAKLAADKEALIQAELAKL